MSTDDGGGGRRSGEDDGDSGRLSLYFLDLNYKITKKISVFVFLNIKMISIFKIF